MTKTFTITCTEKQARVLEQACDLMTRLGLGQVREVIDYLPTQKCVPDRCDPREVDRDKVLKILLDLTHELGFWDFGHSFGVGNDKCQPDSMVAYDLGAVLRNAIDSLRTDRHHSSWGDRPLHYGSEPLAVVTTKDPE